MCFSERTTRHQGQPKRHYPFQWVLSPGLTLGCVLIAGFQATPGYAETLDEAWHIALASDHSVKSAQATTTSARQRVDAAASSRLPSLTLEAGYSAKTDPSAVDVSDLGLPVEAFQVDEKQSASYAASVAVPLYTSGRIHNRIKAAESQAEAAQLDESAVLQMLKLDVAEAYIAVLRARQDKIVADSQVDSLAAHAAETDSLFKQGLTDRNAVLSARVTLADARQQVIQAQNRVDLALSAYNRLLQRPLDTRASLEDPAPQNPPEALPKLIDRALAQRPEILSLTRQVETLQHQSAAERATNRPQLTLNGGYRYDQNKFQVNEGAWAVGVNLKWNAFDGGRSGHDSSAIAKQASALAESLADQRSKLGVAVRKTWLDLHESQSRLEVSQQAVAQADENLRVARSLFKRGMAKHTQVLDAEQLRTRTLNNHTQARYDHLMSAIRLRYELGEL